MSLLLLFQSGAGAPPTFADGALATTGTGTATFVGLAVQSAGALGATGTGATSLVGEGVQTASPLVATGTGTATFIAADAGVTNVGGGDDYTVKGSAYWKKYNKENEALKRKKKKKLDTLDDLLEEVRARVVPWREAQERAKVGEQTMLRAALERPVNIDSTLDQIEGEIRRVKTLLEEIDDEEAVMFFMM